MSNNIHHFEVNNIDLTKVSLSDFKGKTLLIVNVASACGFTPQYTGLQALYEKYKDQGLEILAFPCNQFGNQESGTNEEIKTFCDKVDVKGDNASPLFKFLEDQSGREIKWNFSKFLINKDGEFVKGFGTQKTPEMIEDSIKEIL